MLILISFSHTHTLSGIDVLLLHEKDDHCKAHENGASSVENVFLVG